MTEADIKFVVGISGSGKTVCILDMIKNLERLIIYDGKCSLDYVNDAEAALLIKHQGPKRSESFDVRTKPRHP